MEEPHKIFTFDKLTVFFKHTDYHGFVHPYNYLEWMSYAREAFFQDLVPNFLKLSKSNIKMVTAEVEFECRADAIFGDRIIVKIYSQNVKRLSFDVVFKFYRDKDNLLLGDGRQTLTFLDAETGKPTRIPEELKSAVLLFEKNKPSQELLVERVKDNVGD